MLSAGPDGTLVDRGCSRLEHRRGREACVRRKMVAGEVTVWFVKPVSSNELLQRALESTRGGQVWQKVKGAFCRFLNRED